MYKIDINGQVTDFRKSVHVPDFDTFSSLFFLKYICL